MFLFNKFKDYGLFGKIALFIASFGGTGLVKYASGTVGSLVATLISALLFDWGFMVSWNLYLALATFILGWIAVILLNSKDGIQDPGYIVIDEVSAIFLINYAIFLFVAGGSNHTGFISSSYLYTAHPYYLCLLTFAVFRFFDIVKPSFIGRFDRKVKNSFGVMFDDTLAAIVTIGVVALLFLFTELFNHFFY